MHVCMEKAEAFKDIKRDFDWKRPASAKTWRSKVDYVIWSRIDPAITHLDHDTSFIKERAEKELRAEMIRQASLLKTRARLCGQQDH